MKIVADSCCDITVQEEMDYGVQIVPLTLFLGDESFIDDKNLDIEDYRTKLGLYQGRPTSACPSPGDFLQAFREEEENFCLTVSANLSGTYSSALVAKEMAEEEGMKVEVIDSKTASAGQALLVYEMLDLIKAGLKYEEIKEKIQDFIKNMKTYFVLENMDNLVKGGRLNKVAGKIITALHVHPIMGADGDGNIKLYNYGRTRKQIIDKMVGMVKECKEASDNFKLVIAHHNNIELAESIKEAVNLAFESAVVKIVPTRGLCSMYADNKGVILAF